MSLDFYGDLWRDWLADVARRARSRPPTSRRAIEALPDRLRAVHGDMAMLAKEAKLVDTLAPRDEVRKRLIALVGEDKEKHSFKQIGYGDYLKAKGGDRTGATGRGKAVAVVVAKGTILDGTQPAGHDRRRLDGAAAAPGARERRREGGGAARRQPGRQRLRLRDHPPRVRARAQGRQAPRRLDEHVAASGGYWISTASDEIWAAPETITGSIGIFGVFPTIQKPLAKYLGIHTDGVGTTRFSDAMRPDRALDPAVGDVIQQSINNGYQDFLARVAEARHMTTEQVDKIARGRVWSGEDAKGLGLVDQLGGLPAAIESAAKRAKLEKGYRVWYLEKEKSFREQVAEMLTAGAVVRGRLGLGLERGGGILGLTLLGRRAAPRDPARSSRRSRAGTTRAGSTPTACAARSSDCASSFKT